MKYNTIIFFNIEEEYDEFYCLFSNCYDFNQLATIYKIH